MSLARCLLLISTFSGLCAVGHVNAQTCAAPVALFTDSGGMPPVADTTCGHETAITSICQDSFGAPGQAWVGTLTAAADATFTTITFSGGPGFTLASYLIPVANGCGNFACTTTGDATTPMLHSDIPPGQFYLIVTGADFDVAGACGTFTVTRNGSLPIELRDFTVG